MALNGTEILYVQGVDAQGRPAATETPTTTQDIANLAGVTGVTQIILDGATSGSTTVAPAAVAGGTLTFPTVASVGSIATTTGTNLFMPDLKSVTAQVDATTTTLANVPGLSFTVVPGTYAFRANLPTTCGGTGGVKLAFNYTTAVLSSISATARAYTASAVAVSSTTTTTTQTSIVASNTAFTNVELEGMMVVTTGGTVALQFAENSANSTSSILVNGSMQFTRIV